MSQIGYIYIRLHESYKLYDACKLGKTISLLDRDSVYVTNEIQRGVFNVVYEVPQDKMDLIERLAQMFFEEYHIKFDGGQEFYNSKIIELIDSFFEKINK